MKPTTRILVAAWMIALAGCRSLASARTQDTTLEGAGPAIHSPADKQRIGGPGDPLCPEQELPCYKIRVEGRVPARRTPFVAVEPLQASPRMWIQPPLHGVRSDGSFSGLIYLGEAQNGAQQYFKIHLFACEDQERFREGEQLLQFPKDCLVSESVEIYRER